MIHSSGPEDSLPEEFKKRPFRPSLLRILAMASLMGIAAAFLKAGVQNERAAPSSEGESSAVANTPKVSVDFSSSSPSPVTTEATLSENLSRDKPSQGGISLSNPASFEFLNQSGSLRKYVYNEQSKRAFVAADVINFRLKPGGGLMGQLPKGDVLEVLAEPDQTGFLKVKTSYGQIGYVSKDLLSFDRVFGVFDADRLDLLQPNHVLVSVGGDQNSDELSRHYSFFLELLEKLPTKASFDFSSSNLRYLILAASEVLYPTEPSALLHVIRQSSSKPAVFLERPKMKAPAAEDGVSIKTKLPVRRVPANQGGQSTSLLQVDVSTKCHPLRMTVKTEKPISSKLELVIVDIKKSTNAILTTRPHKGDPSFTWAFADLDGDTWQDLAIYFGGQTSASPYRFLLVAQNMGGSWQLHRIEDRSSVNQGCVKL